MPNHFHLLVGHDAIENLPWVMRDMKKYTSRLIKQYLSKMGEYGKLPWIWPFHSGDQYRVWQEGYHPKQVVNEKVLEQKLKYIHNNPVEKGYVDRSEHWKYSSARNYNSDDHSLIKLDVDWL